MRFVARSVLLASLALSGAVSVSLEALAADRFPTRPIRLIVPYQPGGSTSLSARSVQQALGTTTGTRIVVDNRPGAGTALGTELVARATPDGYTLLLASTPFSILPTLRRDLPYDSVKDFAPISQIASQPYIIAAAADSRFSNLQALIAAAKANPGALSYSSPGPGSGAHLAIEALLLNSGARMLHVPYKGGAPALMATLTGDVDVVLTTVVSGSPLQRSGKLRILAITSPKRLAMVPTVPTVTEAGLPPFEAASWNGIVAPARTPPAVIAQLNREIVSVLRMPAVRQALEKEGAEVVGSSPTEFAAFINREIARWANVIRSAQIKVH
ncbi:MAG: tripartite tricarboxylate transporter substrate binding protein [Betaproteobacteria bacterium]|nr:tripartite tricarboxylate transporter substrate binding protein [Betaproteobacteria bacterium]